MGKYIFFLICCISVIPVLFAQKSVVLVEPKSQSVREDLFAEIKNKLGSNDEIVILDEQISPETLKDILDSHGKTDPKSVETRRGNFQGNNVDYYIEVKQEPDKSEPGKVTNKVNLYSDSTKFVIEWICRKDDFYENKLLNFNLDKIANCIKEDKNKKNILIIRTTNNIRVDSLRDKFDSFGLVFLNKLDEDVEINSKYSLIPIDDAYSRKPPKADYVLGDITLEITLTNDENASIKVNIQISYNLTSDIPVPFSTSVSNRLPIDEFCSRVTTEFLKKHKPKLLNTL